MKRITLILIGLSFVLFQYSFSQTVESKAKTIQIAFNNRDADVLTWYFCDRVELILPDADNTCPKEQAKAVMADFFAKKQPKNFEIIHQGSRENVSFITGKMDGVDGVSYRVNILFKKDGNDLLIYQLRIE